MYAVDWWHCISFETGEVADLAEWRPTCMNMNYFAQHAKSIKVYSLCIKNQSKEKQSNRSMACESLYKAAPSVRILQLQRGWLIWVG